MNTNSDFVARESWQVEDTGKSKLDRFVQLASDADKRERWPGHAANTVLHETIGALKYQASDKSLHTPMERAFAAKLLEDIARRFQEFGQPKGGAQ
jgi:hypothetical protein